MKALRSVAVGLFALFVLAFLGLAIWSGTSTYPAGDAAAAAMESSSSVQVSRGNWIVFTPAVPGGTGLIFYPGGLVEPRAYAPILRQIAEAGVLVVVTPMTFNLAIFDTQAAAPVFDAYPGVSRWFIAGHSLGGTAAAIFTGANPDRVAGLALWDSYPPDGTDLSGTGLPVLSIYGTTGGVPNPDNFDARRHLLPPDAVFVPIEGASHAQFGDYGPQAGDVTPSIPAAEQWRLIAALMLKFIGR